MSGICGPNEKLKYPKACGGMNAISEGAFLRIYNDNITAIENISLGCGLHVRFHRLVRANFGNLANSF